MATRGWYTTIVWTNVVWQCEPTSSSSHWSIYKLMEPTAAATVLCAGKYKEDKLAQWLVAMWKRTSWCCNLSLLASTPWKAGLSFCKPFKMIKFDPLNRGLRRWYSDCKSLSKQKYSYGDFYKVELARTYIQDDDLCSLCGQLAETQFHILCHCEIVAQVSDVFPHTINSLVLVCE